MILAYLLKGIQTPNYEIHSPFPRSIGYREPFREGINDKHERLQAAFSFVVLKLAISEKG